MNTIHDFCYNKNIPTRFKVGIIITQFTITSMIVLFYLSNVLLIIKDFLNSDAIYLRSDLINILFFPLIGLILICVISWAIGSSIGAMLGVSSIYLENDYG